MVSQNYANHRRFVPLYHFFTLTLLLLLFGGSVWNFTDAWLDGDEFLEASLPMITAIAASFIYWYARVFALRAQDRAIRAEENLRHLAMTGKLLDTRLRMGQIIALRFASDGEFLELAGKAAESSLKPEDIKKAIINWRGDFHRA